MLIDSHCHLNKINLADKTLDNIIQEAEMHGVDYIQTVCTKLDEFAEIYDIAQKYYNVFTSVGIHPTEVQNYSDIDAELLANLTQAKKVIGLGETGLDYFHDASKKELQKKIFIEHIRAAHLTNLPVIIHMRDAEQDCYDILRDAKKKYSFNALIHSFSASKAFAEKMLELGIYISISGIVTFNSAKNLQSVVYDLPISRLLLETDAPYLAPTPMRGKQNIPLYLKHTAQFICSLKEIAIGELENITSENFQKLFCKANIA